MQPQSPSPDFDFMLKDQPPAKRGLPIPSLPRPVLYGVFGVVIILVLIFVFSLFSGKDGGSTQPIIGALARNQETLRVTKLVQPQLQDPQTQALAATTFAALTSDQKQLEKYLAQNRANPGAVQLAADTDKSTDTSMQSAAQNNNLDSTYVTYLKDALNRYSTDLKNADQKAGPKGRAILQSAYDSTGSLLGSPLLKS